jgi:hypothetical protein
MSSTLVKKRGEREAAPGSVVFVLEDALKTLKTPLSAELLLG